jgi:hypothetical protein
MAQKKLRALQDFIAFPAQGLPRRCLELLIKPLSHGGLSFL